MQRSRALLGDTRQSVQSETEGADRRGEVGKAFRAGGKGENKKERPENEEERELPQLVVPSSSSWSQGFMVAAAFIFLSQNKRKCQRGIPEDLPCSLHLSDVAYLCALPSPTLYAWCP